MTWNFNNWKVPSRQNVTRVFSWVKIDQVRKISTIARLQWRMTAHRMTQVYFYLREVSWTKSTQLNNATSSCQFVWCDGLSRLSHINMTPTFHSMTGEWRRRLRDLLQSTLLIGLNLSACRHHIAYILVICRLDIRNILQLVLTHRWRPQLVCCCIWAVYNKNLFLLTIFTTVFAPIIRPL